MVINWVLQLGLRGLFVYSKIVAVLTKYTIKRVPNEAVDFAYCLFLKGKTDNEVRNELAEKGWTDKLNQDEVFEAIGGFQSAAELKRMK